MSNTAHTEKQIAWMAANGIEVRRIKGGWQYRKDTWVGRKIVNVKDGRNSKVACRVLDLHTERVSPGFYNNRTEAMRWLAGL